MLSATNDWFTDEGYGNKWSRVLLRKGGDFDYQIELSLEPINDTPGEWQDLLYCRIRKHCTAAAPNAKYTHHLPDRVYQQLSERFGQGVATYMIHSNIYNLIDWELYNHIARADTVGGGIPLRSVIRNQVGLPDAVRLYSGDNPVPGTVSAGDFGAFLDYVSDEANVWDHERYVSLRTMRGKSFGVESTFTYRYVLGNAFCDGSIGDTHFRVYKDHSSFQIYIRNANGSWPTETAFSCTPTKKQEVLAYMQSVCGLS